MNKMEIDELFEDITDGKLDKHLNVLTDIIIERRKVVAGQKLNQFQIGDVVKFNMLAKPKYLKGERATITGFANKRVWIKLEKPAGRFFSGRAISCPTGIIDKVTV